MPTPSTDLPLDSAGSSDNDLPSMSLFAGVVGQARALADLRAAARRPVHAYLLVGEAGLGQGALVRGFAAALLCPNGGCGHCEVCRRALAGSHPDLVEFGRAGAAMSVDDARRVVRLAQRRPLEASRQVISIEDVHLARLAAPVLLKTLEEPAGESVFVLRAETIPAELATVASRCVRIDLTPVSAGELTSWLQGQGVEPEAAAELADAAGGNADRARLLADDAGFAARRALWRSVPTRLDGTGAVAAALAAELLASAEQAVEPLRARQAAEMEELGAQAEAMGERGIPGRKEIEERHNRAVRKWRTDELRAGLANLARAYRDRMVAQVAQGGAGHTPGAPGTGHVESHLRQLAGAVRAVEEVAAELIRNRNETLMLEALMVRLSAIGA